MTRRTKRITGGSALLLAAAGVAVSLWPRGPYPCRATFERVTAGMTRAEVEDAVGGPPGDYARGRAITRFAVADGWAPRPGATTWVAADGELMVWFGPDGTATDAEVEDVAYFPATFLTRLRGRLGL